MSSQEPTRTESIAQKHYILDLLWNVHESACIWRRLILDPAACTALDHIVHATGVLIDRCDLLTVPPRPEPAPAEDPLIHFLP